MKVRSVSFFKAVSPLSIPISDSTHDIPEIAFIVTRLECDDGLVGESYLLSFHYSPSAILGALKDAGEMVRGWSVDRTNDFIVHYERESEYFGTVGIHRWALGSINIAMWDAWARHLEKPVWRMFELHIDRIPLYGSGGWLSYSTEELLEEVVAYSRRGFRAVKVKVGSPDPARDLERLAKVREAVGPTIEVMMDANQGLDLDGAKRLARDACRLNIGWFEEPLARTDFEGYVALKKTTSIPIAMGEREFDTVALRELSARHAIDLWQPDILRLGSLEAWRASAEMANRSNVPVLPHYYKEYDVPLLMTIPNGRGSESFDWVDPLITRPIRMEHGYAYPTDQPGWGFKFKDGYLTEIATC